jgi:hypothetical protein
MRCRLLAVTALAGAALSLPVSGTPAGAVPVAARPPVTVAPYVDMGSPGLFPTALHAVRSAHLRTVTAAFVVSRRNTGCTPRWDSERRLTDDPTSSRFLHRLRSAGAGLIVSFGGELLGGNHELASTCHSTSRLAEAYDRVVTSLRVTRLDFDIEGVSLTQHAANARRFRALREVLRDHPRVTFSLTEPVDPDGLPGTVRRLLRQARAAGVRPATLNIMTMDYGRKIEMGTAAIRAARATRPQLRRVFPGSGWRSLGVTPEIGRNDTRSEIFTLADAARLARWSRRHGVGRLAFWSLGRDVECSEPAPTAQDDCSGVDQRPAAFSHAFARA